MKLTNTQKYSNVEFLRPLLKATTNSNPVYRSSLGELVKLWHIHRDGLSWYARADQLQKTSETTSVTLYARAQWLLRFIVFYFWLLIAQRRRFLVSPAHQHIKTS